MESLYQKLLEISDKNKISFHMPGTKGGLALPKGYSSDVFKIDFTELRDTDNLYAPSGIIKKAQEEVAEIYKARNSFFLVNGTSGGILASFGYMCKKNKKIIMDRNCHISAVNAAGLFDAHIIFAMPEYKQKWGHAGCVNAEEIEKILKKEKNIGAVFITSPNYYGWTADVEKISAICKTYNVILCVDAAHGAHFPFSDKLPKSPIEAGGDIVLMSMHKTLPSPTQTSVMHTSKNIDAVEMKKWINMFQTTSPSYIFMAYIHLAAKYMKLNGERIYSELYKNINEMNINKIEEQPFKDFSRIVINTIDMGVTGYELSDHLYKNYDIETEMADLYNVVCIAGAGNNKIHFDILERGCNDLISGNKTFKTLPLPPYANMECNPGKYLYADKIKCKLELSANKTLAEHISVYPPGVPVAVPGETMTREMIDYILSVKIAGGAIIGIENGFVSIVSN